MRYAALSVILSVVLCVGFVACSTAPKLPALTQLKPVVKAAILVAQTQGKISPEQAGQLNTVIDGMSGSNMDLSSLGKLALATAISSGKVTPEQASEIQLILDALNTQGVVATVTPTPTPVPAVVGS